MKKISVAIVTLWMAVGTSGCFENGLACDEASFKDKCIDSTYLEVCTYGERARLKCPTECYSDDEGNGSCHK